MRINAVQVRQPEFQRSQPRLTGCYIYNSARNVTTKYRTSLLVASDASTYRDISCQNITDI